MSIKKDVTCPECNHRLKSGNYLHQGQQIVCPGCESKLVVVSMNPVELELTSLTDHLAGATQLSNTTEVSCPECDDFIKLKAHAHKGHRVLCRNCNTTLEVINTHPLELEVALMVNYKRNRRYDSDERNTFAKKSGKSRKQKK